MKIKAVVSVGGPLGVRVHEVLPQEAGPCYEPSVRRLLTAHTFKLKLEPGVWLFAGEVEGRKTTTGSFQFVARGLVSLAEVVVKAEGA